MRIIVGAGTDVASVGVGDPALLVSLSECKGRGCEKLRADAVASGALWLAETGADGAYLFHLYVDEEPPSDIAPYLKDPIVVEPFRVTSGKLRVAGEECFVGAISLADYPHMGSEVEVGPGEYKLTAFRSEAADELLEGRFAERATPEQRRAWSFGNRLAAICVFATVAALILGYFIYLRTVSVWLALLPVAVAVALWVGRRRYCQGSRYLAAEKLFRVVENELPSIALVLKKRAGCPTKD
jgi:hypothetical protein